MFRLSLVGILKRNPIALLAIPLLLVCQFFPAVEGFPSQVWQTAPPPRFDVASIRLSSAPAARIRRIDVGVLDIFGMSERDLIELAYGLRSYELAVNSASLDSRRYDIFAKDTTVSSIDSRTLSRQQWAEALAANYEKLRALLAERFALRVHFETRQMRVYSLVVSDRKKLKESTCSEKYYLQSGLARGQIRMSSLAAQLSHDTEKPVRDATHLDGCYDLDLKWTEAPENSDVPSPSSALHDVGLRLRSETGSVKVLVVDHVETPSPN